MRIILSILLLSICYSQVYDYSLYDINTSSSTYGEAISPNYFQGQVTLHYFGHQYWGTCTARVGQLNGLYQDLLNSRVGSLQINSKDLVDHAYTKKVMIVSPMSLFPMLQITVKALHNLKVEKSIEDILKNIDKLSNHLNTYKDSHDRLGKTISTAVNHYNKSSNEFKKIDKDFIKISGGTRGIDFEPQLLEKPNINEE